MRSLPDFNPGAQIASGKKLRQMRGAVRELQQKPAYDYDNNHRWHVVAEGMGLIVRKGPNGETFPSGTVIDERYWVQPIYINGSKIWDKITTSKNGLANPKIVCVTNWAEVLTHSHALPYNKRVKIELHWDRGSPSRLHWTMDYEPPWRLAIKATTWTDSSALGVGRYRCRIKNSDFALQSINKGAITLGGDGDFGTEGTVDVIALNVQESAPGILGATNHDLTPESGGPDVGSYYPLTFPAQLMGIDDDEKIITFMINATQWRPC